MNKIIVNTQAELDAIPRDFDGVIEIYGGTLDNPIVVRSAYKSALVKARGFATVWAYGYATVCAYDSATVRAYNSATVLAFGSAAVVARDDTTVHAYGSAKVFYD